jgi:hypothetical protein
LIKTLLPRKQPSIKQVIPVEKNTLLTAVVISLLLFSAVEALFVKSTQANPYIRDWRYTKISPPAGITPPSIIIHTPQNGSFYPKNFNLTFDVIIPNANGELNYGISELYYKASWDPNEIEVTPFYFRGNSTSFSIDLSGVLGGNHSITIFAVGYGYDLTNAELDGVYMTYYYDEFEIIGFSTVRFVKDVVSPMISFLSPPNGTYVKSDVELDFAVNEPVSEVSYCLDGTQNQTVTDSLTLTGLTEGSHNITLYAADLAGNAAAPKILFFNVDLPEPFPMTFVIVSVITVSVFGLGLMVNFKKHNQ